MDAKKWLNKVIGKKIRCSSWSEFTYFIVPAQYVCSIFDKHYFKANESDALWPIRNGFNGCENTGKKWRIVE